MKFVYAILMSLSMSFTRAPIELSINQSIHLPEEVTMIVLDFDDQIEIVETAGNVIELETRLISSQPTVLEYQNSKQHFKIVPAYLRSGSHLKVILKPKRINTSILVDGELCDTKKKYKIKAPAHIQIVRQ